MEVIPRLESGAKILDERKVTEPAPKTINPIWDETLELGREIPLHTISHFFFRIKVLCVWLSVSFNNYYDLFLLQIRTRIS